MTYNIEKAVEFIEENLKNKITLGDIAEAAGYSPYHFVRLFRETVGLTPGDYIRKRRLSEIAREMETSTKTAGELAYSYGFHSKENFTRAFYREHKVLPTEYRTAQNSLKLYGRYVFQKPFISVEPEILTLERLTLTGYHSDETYTPKFWNKYNCGNLSKKLSGGKVCEDFGVCIWNAAQRKLDYFIGIRSEEALGDLTGTDTLSIPGGVYAVFATPATTQDRFVSTIHATWEYIYAVWMPRSPYRRNADGCEFESYVEESRTYSERIHIPVTRK